MSQPVSNSRKFFLERLAALPLEGYFMELPDKETAKSAWGFRGAHR